MATHTIDCTPTDDGYMAMANCMLETIFNTCTKKAEKERLDSLLTGVFDIYKYLYFKGYVYKDGTIKKRD